MRHCGSSGLEDTGDGTRRGKDGEVARIGVQGYFAVTSNTAQFGAKAELFFGFSAISVEGHLGFDALFQFSPFRFVVQISAGVSVKVFGVGVFSVHLDVALSGPTPWQIKGSASISFLKAPLLEISSSRARQAAAEGRPLEDLVGPRVAAYISEHQLYGAGSPGG